MVIGETNMLACIVACYRYCVVADDVLLLWLCLPGSHLWIGASYTLQQNARK